MKAQIQSILELLGMVYLVFCSAAFFGIATRTLTGMPRIDIVFSLDLVGLFTTGILIFFFFVVALRKELDRIQKTLGIAKQSP